MTRPLPARPAALVAMTVLVVALAGCSAGATTGSDTAEPASQATSKGDAAASVVAADTGIDVIRTVEASRDSVYLTIDDGQHRDPAFARWVSQRRVPLTMFLVGRSLSDQASYFNVLDRSGSRIENHTMRHQRLTALSATAQKREICQQSEVVERITGTRPTLLRPPYGAYNAATLRAAARCGIDQLVLWSVSIRDGVVSYADDRDQDEGFRAGDIVLLHFSKQEGIADIQEALKQARQAGLRPALLPAR